MNGLVWLASYPKSGNTWFRMMVANLSAKNGEPADINKLPERGGLASARGPFDNLTLIESGLLTHEEADCLRPRVYEELARGAEDDIPPAVVEEPMQGPRFMKVHDAYTVTPSGEPLLTAGSAAIVIIRDPRDVAISLAHHMSSTIDEAISFMGKKESTFAGNRSRQAQQLRQKLLGWSGHVTSWLDQRDIASHWVRYEDLHQSPASSFQRAMRFAGRPISSEEAERAAKLAHFGNLQRQERESGFSERTSKTTPFFREGRAGAWRDVLSSDQIGRIEADHGKVMTRFDYPLLAR
jgi:hypothetical protein